MGTNKRLLLKDIYVGELAKNYTTASIALDDSIGFACVIKKTDVTLTNKTFTSVSLSAISIAAHGYQAGLKVRFTTTGALPTGLALATDFYLIRISADTLMVAATQSGSYIVLSGGTGTHTVVPQPVETVNFFFEVSLDEITWVKLSEQIYQITSTAQLVEYDTAFTAFVRCAIEITSGQFDLSSKIMVKGF